MSVVEASVDAAALESPFDWPLFGLQDDVRPILADAAARGVRTVLATLYGVVGAAPRGVGAQMVFAEDLIAGFLSSGCLEADLAIRARRVLASQQSERLTYGEGGPMDIRLPCGSRIDIILEPIGKADPALARLLQLGNERRPALWLTNGEERACIAATDIAAAPARLHAAATLAASDERLCGFAPAPFAMFRTFAPRRRLIAIGGDPIALAVVKLAAEMGFETIMVRPRGPTRCPLPGVLYDRSEVEAAITAARPDPWTAVAILTHDLEQEHAGLTAALATHAGYVGVLGSRRRAPERMVRLADAGISDQNMKRIHAPIGLAIRSNSPWEIAVSVIAEVVRDLGAARRPSP